MDDAVKRWLIELRDVTETECMSVLQGKSLNCKKDPDQTVFLVTEIKGEWCTAQTGTIVY